MKLSKIVKTFLIAGCTLSCIQSTMAEKTKIANNRSIAGTATLADIDSHEAAGNYYCYPWLHMNPPAQTPAPEGFKPFHMEHAGRHGSRWLIGYKQYDRALDLLEKGERNGKLTPLGKKVLETVRSIHSAAQGREGELSDNGALQHQGIGKRMTQNYPDLFNSSTNINAKSTIVIRSILSMFNGLMGILTEVPDVNIKTDASKGDMWYMDADDEGAEQARKHADKNEKKDFNKKHDNKGEYLNKLFNDPQFAQDSIGSKLFSNLFSVLANTQSHSDQPWLLDEVFSIDEIRERWAERNVTWFIHAGNSKMTGNRMPFSQSNLLRDIIESVDTAVISKNPSVNLRYNHDTVVFPLATLMEIDNLGNEINDLELLGEFGWHDYQVVPMAGNIQLIFYRKNDSTDINNVLFKVLLNEREVTLPFKAVEGPYYRWKDAKDYYSNKIAPYVTQR